MSPIKTINILECGADPTGQTVCTDSIQRALDAVDGTQTTRIIIPSGEFLTGLLYLHSHTEIHLEDGAILKASPNYEDHLHEGKPCGILLARNSEDVSITGQGEINGNEYAWFHMDRSRTFIDYDLESIRQGSDFTAFANPFPDGPVEPKPRPGNLLIFSNCHNVELRDFKIYGSPYWTIHLADCVNIHAENLTIHHDQNIPNNDGIHLTSCRHALLRNLDIRSGDDAIALTGFRKLEGEPELESAFLDLDGALSDIRVENCRLSSRSSAIRIGYGSNNMSGIKITDTEIYDSNRGILIQARDAGDIEDVLFKDITIQTRFMAGSWWGNGEPISVSAIHRLAPEDKLGSIKNVRFENVTMKSPSPVFLYALQKGEVEGITFENCKLHRVPDPLTAQRGKTVDLRPVHDFKKSLLNTSESLLYSVNVETAAEIR